MNKTIQKKNLFNESDSNFNVSTVDILNVTSQIDLSKANITGIDADDVIETSTRVFVTPSQKSQISTNQNNISTNVSNISTNETNISNNTSAIGTNTTDIDTNTSNIASNTSTIGTNTTNISTNTSNIASNTSAIGTNTTNIGTNTTDISTNAGNISTNASNISSAQDDIDGFPDALKNLTTFIISQLENIGINAISASNWNRISKINQYLSTSGEPFFLSMTTYDIFVDNIRSRVAGDIDIGDVIINSGLVDGRNVSADGTQLDTNTSDIATNTTNIGTNTTNIGTNTTDIGTNTTDIGTNTTNIGTNTTDIGTNTTNISTNTTNISTNTTDIGTNATNIATNTNNIGNISAAFGADMAALQADVDGFPDELKNLTTSIITQLENIGTKVITGTIWDYVRFMDQYVSSTASPTFNGIYANGQLSTDTINERTTDTGVTVDGVLIKDGKLHSSNIGYYLEINQSTSSSGTINLTTTTTDLTTPTFDITIDDYTTELVEIKGTLKFLTTGSKAYVLVRLSRDSTPVKTFSEEITHNESSASYKTLSFSYIDKLTSNDTYTYSFGLAASSVSPNVKLEKQNSVLSVNKLYCGNHTIIQQSWS